VSAEELRQAYESLIDGDPELLVSMMRDDMIWRGRKSTWRFWRAAPT